MFRVCTFSASGTESIEPISSHLSFSAQSCSIWVVCVGVMYLHCLEFEDGLEIVHPSVHPPSIWSRSRVQPEQVTSPFTPVDEFELLIHPTCVCLDCGSTQRTPTQTRVEAHRKSPVKGLNFAKHCNKNQLNKALNTFNLQYFGCWGHWWDLALFIQCVCSPIQSLFVPLWPSPEYPCWAGHWIMTWRGHPVGSRPSVSAESRGPVGLQHEHWEMFLCCSAKAAVGHFVMFEYVVCVCVCVFTFTSKHTSAGGSEWALVFSVAAVEWNLRTWLLYSVVWFFCVSKRKHWRGSVAVVFCWPTLCMQNIF